MKQLLTLLFVAVLGLTACDNCLDGSGDILTEDRITEEFTGIHNDLVADVYVDYGDEVSVSVKADDNIMDYITTKVRKGVLYIDTDKDICPTKIDVFITMPLVESLETDGSGDIYLRSDFSGRNLDINIDGSGDIYTMSYTTDGQVHLNIDGSGDIEMLQTECRNAVFDIDGSGDIELLQLDCANLIHKTDGSGNLTIDLLNSQDVSAEISGSGDVDLTGNSHTCGMAIEGSGTINGLNLAAKIATARISGSGNIYIQVSDNLSVNISGSGDVFYRGNPSIDYIDVSGSGALRKID